MPTAIDDTDTNLSAIVKAVADVLREHGTDADAVARPSRVSLRLLVAAVAAAWLVTAVVIALCDLRNLDGGWGGFALAMAASLSVVAIQVRHHRRRSRHDRRLARKLAEQGELTRAEVAKVAGAIGDLRQGQIEMAKKVSAVRVALDDMVAGRLDRFDARIDVLEKVEAKRQAHRHPRRRNQPKSGALAGLNPSAEVQHRVNGASNVTAMPNSKAFDLGRQVERRRWERHNGTE